MMNNRPTKIFVRQAILSIVLLLVSCRRPPSYSSYEIRATPRLTTPTATQAASDSLYPTLKPTRTQAIATPKMEFRRETASNVCSPLAGVPLNVIADTIVNPFNPPRVGSDDPHQGIDMAELKGDPRIAVSGLGVNSVTDGKIAAIINGSFPYGNAVMIETPLGNISEEWKLQPTPSAADSTLPYKSPLSCPDDYDIIPESEHEGLALYLLYAHMAEPPIYQIGEKVTCGQMLGQIGNSGNALNPHLHLEIRIGPVNMQFAGISHYDSRATAPEMGNYCLWRVSGKFHLVDPSFVLSGTGE
jgi:murein DD-endopeptidase MepM/ murein hydrolase activator NlpD